MFIIGLKSGVLNPRSRNQKSPRTANASQLRLAFFWRILRSTRFHDSRILPGTSFGKEVYGCLGSKPGKACRKGSGSFNRPVDKCGSNGNKNALETESSRWNLEILRHCTYLRPYEIVCEKHSPNFLFNQFGSLAPENQFSIQETLLHFPICKFNLPSLNVVFGDRSSIVDPRVHERGKESVWFSVDRSFDESSFPVLRERWIFLARLRRDDESDMEIPDSECFDYLVTDLVFCSQEPMMTFSERLPCREKCA